MFLRFLNIKHLYFSITFPVLILLSSCAQKGCPGGMCKPGHYYSSPKSISIFSSGSSKSYKGQRNFYVGRSRKIVRSIEYNQRKDWTKPKNPGKMEKSAFGSGRAGSRPGNIEKTPIAISRGSGKGSNIERNPMEMAKSRGGGSNIERNPMAMSKGSGRRVNIERNPILMPGGSSSSANIERSPFRGDDKSSYSNIEADPFKVRRSARKRSNEVYRAVRYKQRQNKKSTSKYGLFSPEVEGWETITAPTTPSKKDRKKGRGTKHPHGRMIK